MRPHTQEPQFKALRETFDTLPHVRALGLVIESLRRGTTLLRCDYRPWLVGDPESGVLHGGVVTSVLDTACGLVTFTMLDEPRSVATLDLRIDYLKPAAPGRPVYGRAEVYRTTRHVTFARGQAYQASPDDPVASCVATFMVGSVGFTVQGGEPV